MYHFFVPQAAICDDKITITGPDVNHIGNVLRMKPGDAIVVSDGQDRDYYCLIDELTRETVTVSIQPQAVEDSELPASLHLFQGLPKGDKMELIVQKAVELGAVSITPVEMKRSIVKLDEKKKKSRVQRWQTIAESAAKQSGRRLCPQVRPVATLREAVAAAGGLDLVLVPYENEHGMEATRAALSEMSAGKSVGIFIGPEGGFEPSEIEQLLAAGGKSISLGRRILRTETAGLVALSLCMLQLELHGGEAQPRE